MASRKWIAADGSQFDKKAEVVAYETYTPHINFLTQKLGVAEDSAKKVLDYFEKNFRVPKTRAKKVPAAPGAPAPVADKKAA